MYMHNNHCHRATAHLQLNYYYYYYYYYYIFNLEGAESLLEKK
jgi:hypothetical protein